MSVSHWKFPIIPALSAHHSHGGKASQMYRLLGEEGLAAATMPPVNQPVQSIIGCHVRTGEHDVRDYDWQRFMDFADKHLGKDE